ncbi:MAG TPA: hypothetical protein VGN72_19150 [Tepidisphaeraceae bacterium]|jgi:hypothetical protein|nr:hypothetical protein [Tepidisphaeraceae bacterium]
MSEPRHVGDLIRVARAVAPLLLLSAIAISACWFFAGPTMGLAFAGFGIVTLMVPTGALDRSGTTGSLKQPTQVLLVQVAIVLPVLVAWACATVVGAWDGGALAGLMVLLVTYASAIAMTACLLALVVPRAITSSFMTVVGIAWLAWPIWTAPWMGESSANRLIAVHPLFAVNRVTGLIPWPQHEVIYGLTRLGQDVPYALPSSALGAVGLNVLVIVLALVLQFAARRYVQRPTR